MKPKLSPASLTIAFLIVTAVLAGGGLPGATRARAGETSAPPADEQRSRDLPPSLAVLVRVDEPESLPAATELQDWLVDRLRRHRKRFSAVVSLEPHVTTAGAAADFLLVIRLAHLSPYDEAPRRLWRPIAMRGPGKTRPLHASQVPLQAQLTITARDGPRVRSQTVLSAQSTGRTVTAGTTKPVAFLLGEKIMVHLKNASRGTVFDL